MAKADAKILRVGIIQGGKIVEERLMRRRERITIGQSPKNTFTSQSASCPTAYLFSKLETGTTILF